MTFIEGVKNRAVVVKKVLTEEKVQIDGEGGWAICRSLGNLTNGLLFGTPNVLDVKRRKVSWFGSPRSRDAFDRNSVGLP